MSEKENPDSNFTDKQKELLRKANQKYSEFLLNKIQDEKVKVKPSNIIEKAKSFATSMVSRGITNKKCSEDTKLLRILSCHGDGTSLMPCSERKASTKYSESFYCGACGCGDKKGTQLVNITINGQSEYSKLDYPKVSCPLKMPGFTDYTPSENGVSENNRKKEIENRYGIQYIEQQSNPQ
jgi:hypothetical protein